MSEKISRRQALAGITAGALASSVAVACSSSTSNTKRDGLAGEGNASCTLYTQQTEGPFYLDDDLLRQDVTEGRSGAPLSLTIRALDAAAACAPLASVVVDIWQCDAEGIYSGFPGQLGGLDTSGKTFLRGSQRTDAQGNALFKTIYPGWYPGRTTHIHFKVHKTATSEATSQLYFPEDVTSSVYKLAPYAARGDKDTPNSADGIATAGGTQQAPLVQVKALAGGAYEATLVVVVA